MFYSFKCYQTHVCNLPKEVRKSHHVEEACVRVCVCLCERESGWDHVIRYTCQARCTPKTSPPAFHWILVGLDRLAGAQMKHGGQSTCTPAHVIGCLRRCQRRRGQAVMKLRKSAINTTGKWRKESWTGAAQSQNDESAPRLLVKCDNLLASQAGLNMTGVRWAAQSCRMNPGHPTKLLLGEGDGPPNAV